MDNMFCNASTRPPVCKLNTNLCCIFCAKAPSCNAECLTNGIGPRPCAELDEEGECEFLI